MRKIVMLCTVFLVITLAGCSKKQQMVDFIPTATPSPQSGAASDKKADANQEKTDTKKSEVDTQSEAEDTKDTPAEDVQTVTKYVKLNKYGDVLNIRATPSATGEKLGFLVHTEKIDVMEIMDGWASFNKDGKTCYVKADYLVDVMPEYLDAPAQTATPTPIPLP